MDKSKITDESVDKPTDYTITRYSNKLTIKHVQCYDFTQQAKFSIVTTSSEM